MMVVYFFSCERKSSKKRNVDAWEFRTLRSPTGALPLDPARDLGPLTPYLTQFCA